MVSNNIHMEKGCTLGIAVVITMLALLMAGGAGASTFTVNANGGADYSRIQDAIDNATAGDTIEVHRGTYYENVNVNKQLTLRGVDTGVFKPVVNAGGNGNAITLSAGGSTLEGFTAINGSAGVYVGSYIDNNIIKNNTARLNSRGFDLYNSHDNKLNDNNASKNGQGIYLLDSYDNTLTGNNASNNNEGINMVGGLEGSNQLINNIMMENKYNFLLNIYEFDYDFPSNMIDTSNLVDGKPIYYINGGLDTVYDSSINAGTFYCLNCVNVTIKDMNLSKNGAGIYFWKTKNSRIQNVNTSNNKKGIILLSSPDNMVNGNHAWNNANSGIEVQCGNPTLYPEFGCNSNKLVNNIVSNNSIGFYLGSSLGSWMWGYSYLFNNTLVGNKASYNTDWGIYLESLSPTQGGTYHEEAHNNISYNTIYKNGNGIYLNSLNNTLIGNNASNNINSGIYLDSTIEYYDSGCGCTEKAGDLGENTLTYNTASNNGNGIYIQYSSHNTLTDNNIFNNKNGITLNYSGNNHINNNNFSNVNNANDNGNNIWNTTKTAEKNIIGGSYLGGNFWANPGGTGFSQTCPDNTKDGICDLPYTLNSNNIDYLPLAYNKIPPATITSWSNNKTRNNNLTLTINKSEVIKFNATANQPVTTWRWYKDNIYQANNYNNFSTSWTTQGSYTIKVNATNPNGTSNTITWYVGINPPKIGKGASPWTGFSAMEHTSEDKGRPGTAMIGLFRDSFNDNDYDWTVSYGNLSVVNGKLQAYGNVNARLSRNIGKHTNVAMFVSMNETNLDGIKDFSVRADTSRNDLAKTYYLSVRPDGKEIRIVTMNATSWIDVNISTWQRKAKQTSYCILTAYNSNFKGYCSNRSFTHAMSLPPVSSGTNSLYSYGNRIGLGTLFNITRGTDITTFDDVAVLELDSIGNIRTTGNLTTSYDAGAGKWVYRIRVNATTPVNTNYTAWYRQTNTGTYTQTGGVYTTGSNIITISGTKYRNTQVQLRLQGNKTASPEIESIEYFLQNAVQAITVVSPNGLENWTRGTTKTINWTSSGSTGAYVKIELLKTGVANTVIIASTPNDKSQNWTILSTQAPGVDYKVRITSTTNLAYNDTSNSNFTIGI